jgi:hypothetical protein
MEQPGHQNEKERAKDKGYMNWNQEGNCRCVESKDRTQKLMNEDGRVLKNRELDEPNKIKPKIWRGERGGGGNFLSILRNKRFGVGDGETRRKQRMDVRYHVDVGWFIYTGLRSGHGRDGQLRFV